MNACIQPQRGYHRRCWVRRRHDVVFRARRHDTNEERDTERAGYLRQGVHDRRAVRVILTRQLVQTVRLGRHHNHRHRDAHRTMQQDDRSGARLQRNASEQPHDKDQNRGAGNNERPRSELIEQLAGYRRQEAVQDTARQQDETRSESGHPHARLHQDRQQHQRGEQRHHHDNDLNRCESEHWRFEGAQIKNRRFGDELAPDEQRKRNAAGNDEGIHARIRPAVLNFTQAAEAVDDAAEGDRGQQDRQYVDARLRHIRNVLQEDECKYDREDRERKHKVEQPSPSQTLQNQTRQRRSNRRCEHDHKADTAHGGAALLRRIQDENRVHHDWKHETCAECLDNTAYQQEGELRRNGADQRSDGEHDHRPEEHLSRREPLHKQGGCRNKHRNDKHVARRQPLNGGVLDIKFLLKINECDIQ